MNFEEMNKEELVKYIKELNEEQNGKYGLIWDKEKELEEIVVNCDKYIPVLKEVKEKNINNSGQENILIEGDNFHSLSVLNYTHKEKIDVIYIDPPYNTGNKDFMYNDKFIDVEDGYRHSKWLNFIQKRLRIARNLLKDTGVIFVSIDDNEYAQLKLLMDKIFGENNLLSIHHIQVRYGNKSLNEKKDFQEVLEYVLIYAKDKQSFVPNKPTDEYDIGKFNLNIKELRKPDSTIVVGNKKVDIFKKGSYEITKEEASVDYFKETWLSGSIYSGTGHGKTYQKICEPRVNEDGLSTLYKIHGLGEDGLGYRYMINPQKDGSNRGKMFTKVPINQKEMIEKGEFNKTSPITNFYDFSPDFGNIRHEGGVGFNSGKKPIKMLKQFINYHQDQNSVILDFFAGSGSTGHAVLDLNNEDGGNRKFILCTNNESNICEEITYPRLRNVINGYGNKEALGGTLKYFKTDFVDNVGTRDQLYYDLTEKCIPMLCVKEETFDQVELNEEYAVYTNKEKSKYTFVYFDIFGNKYNDFKEMLEKIDEEKALYIFTLGDYVNTDDLKNVKNYTIEAIPYRILDLYKKVIKMSKED